jgi:urea ABC transporter permease protein UrtC
MIINSRFFNRSELIGFVTLALLLFVILPLSLDVFRLNLVAKYLTYAFVAIGLVLCWGYGGILSLGQGVFFGLGGYCMAMYLKLEASSVENTKIQSTPGIPDFMDWNQITQLPFFWKPFHSFPITLLAIILVPTIFSFIIGAAMFKRRVGGVYFAIITQAIAAILTILIVGQQGYTGGINGITDLRTLHGWDIRTDHAKLILYFVEVVLLFGCIMVAQFIRLTKLGRILVAMREQEDRVRFSGYSVANFKIFAFSAAAIFAAIIPVPGFFAFIIGAAMFKRRVGGVYFAIITQAIAAILTILIVGQQGYTGGINGITDLRTLHGWDIRTDHAKVILYFVEVVLLFGCIFAAQFIRLTKLGRILVAMREQEDRVRFSGYSVANFKIFAFSAAAIFAAIGGAMFTLEVGFMSPSFVGIVPSIEMVIYTAVGGRTSIFGAVYGTILVNFAKTSLSESFPQLWLFGLGALFIAVVLVFPNGLAGIWGDYVQPRIDRLIASRRTKSGKGWTGSSVADGAPAE